MDSKTHHHHEDMTTEHIHPTDPTSTDDPHSGHTTGDPDHSDHDSMPGMKMYFHAGVNEIILFKSWKTDSVGEFIGGVIAIFFLGFLYEGVKFGREYLFQKYVQKKCQCAPHHGGENSHGSGSNNSLIRSYRTKMLSLFHFLQSFCHMIQFIIAYLLMLIFMTYNIWLCLAVTLGSLCGYFVFGWKKTVTVDLSEHCH